jgi:hypothetical protein
MQTNLNFYHIQNHNLIYKIIKIIKPYKYKNNKLRIFLITAFKQVIKLYLEHHQ